MKRFLTVLVLGAFVAVPAAFAQDGVYNGKYGWTISNSSTNSLQNFGAPDMSTGTPQLYLWLHCTPSGAGCSAAEFDLTPGGFTAVFGFSAVPPYLNGGPSATQLQIVLGCASGGTLVGSFVANAGYTGDLCLVPSAANGYNVSVDCGSASFGKHTNTTVGFSLNGSGNPACTENLCVVAVEEQSWGGIKGLYR